MSFPPGRSSKNSNTPALQSMMHLMIRDDSNHRNHPLQLSHLLRRLVYSQFWNRNHKLTAPIADKFELIHNFILQVPGEDKNIIRTGFFYLVGMMNGNQRTREETSVF